MERVSIHAPRVGRDFWFAVTPSSSRCFNSRAPRGARPDLAAERERRKTFQFTRPAWGATQRARKQRN